MATIDEVRYGVITNPRVCLRIDLRATGQLMVRLGYVLHDRAADEDQTMAAVIAYARASVRRLNETLGEIERQAITVGLIDPTKPQTPAAPERKGGNMTKTTKAKAFKATTKTASKGGKAVSRKATTKTKAKGQSAE